MGVLGTPLTNQGTHKHKYSLSMSAPPAVLIRSTLVRTTIFRVFNLNPYVFSCVGTVQLAGWELYGYSRQCGIDCL